MVLLSDLNHNNRIGTMKMKVAASALHVPLLVAAAMATLVMAIDEIPHKQPTDPSMIFFDKYSVSVASNVTVSVEILPEAKELSIVPNGATIDPLGHTTVVFDITGVETNSSATFPILFIVPITTYMDLPITGSVAQTLPIAPSTSIAVQGFTTTITRVLYGFSRQTFPQLNRVVISKVSSEWPYSMSELTTFQIPSLI